MNPISSLPIPADAECYNVLLSPGGARFKAHAQETILQAGLAAGVELPSSCRNGTCRTCLCHMLQGQVAYTIAWPGLSAEEKADGWCLPCVALARSDLVLDQTPVPPANLCAAR